MTINTLHKTTHSTLTFWYFKVGECGCTVYEQQKLWNNSEWWSCCCTTGLSEAKCAEKSQQQRRLQDGRSPLFCASNFSRVGTKMYFIVSPKFLYDNKRQYLKIEIHCEFSLGNVLNFADMFGAFCKKIYKMSASCQFCAGESPGDSQIHIKFLRIFIDELFFSFRESFVLG